MNEPHHESASTLFERRRTVPIHSPQPSTDIAQLPPETNDEPGANPSEPVRTGSEPVEIAEVWLTVEDALAYCSEQGLSRTAKTLRKWAERSYKIPEGEVVSDREDTIWGRYRWKIERSSLERKVAEELGRERQNQGAPVQTSAHQSDEVRSKEAEMPSSHPSEPVRTSANTHTVSLSEKPNRSLNASAANSTAQVRTGSNGEVTEDAAQMDLATLRAENRELRAQQKRDRDEIAFLRDEVTFNRSLKTDLAQNSHRLLETLETMAIGGRLERPASQVPVAATRYQHQDRESDEV
ncbi:hypothetical protein [Pontivivens insulae]|nr:hypothetical protein [Pontivivens insulae]